eukprot:CAMPEP_0182505402 /NCGR_PEP_ID=MMETSP1321-20130603/19155_1 /TAXON_ID=91990 /ORGANISM="Bolidomonas sp., Strain RCC1657" /LENGTH=168 /DNA_ID=CAMNT_0024710933 /DNA_START=631 /DNA_END=1136 /DNA_ORIENTATION=-
MKKNIETPQKTGLWSPLKSRTLCLDGSFPAEFKKAVDGPAEEDHHQAEVHNLECIPAPGQQLLLVREAPVELEAVNYQHDAEENVKGAQVSQVPLVKLLAVANAQPDDDSDQDDICCKVRVSVSLSVKFLPVWLVNDTDVVHRKQTEAGELQNVREQEEEQGRRLIPL